MYVTLYRKYRPLKFKDVVGQEYIVTTLKNEIKLKKIAHAYIFTGPRGTGKTTCAKIFSKTINCKNEKDGEPCCECEICKGLQEGFILDITEIDGASNNSVNDIRLLRDETNFVPTYCKYRVYIIDEVHMLSSSAFAALLKIMEEPPKYVVFILATTEISKVPKTILSRCQRFDFKRIKPNEIKSNIEKIANEEKINISEKAAFKIALISQGSMRDALSILDKCSIESLEITEQLLEKILGIIEKKDVLNLHEAVKNKDRLKVLEIIENIYYSGKNLEDVLQEILNFYREMLYFCVLKEKAKNFLEYNEYLEEIEKIDCFNFQKTNLILENILDCYEKIKNSSEKKLMLELKFLKIAQTLSCEETKEDEKEDEQKETESYKINLEQKTQQTEKFKISTEKEISNKIKEEKNILEKLIEIAKEKKIPFEEN